MADEKHINVILHLRSAPFNADPEWATDFYEAIGKITVLWAKAEANLDILLLIAIDIAVRHGIRENVPIGLDRKISLLRRLYRDCPALADLKDNVYSLARAIAATHQNRSALSHNRLQGFITTGTPTMVFASFLHKDGNIHQGSYRFTLSRLNKVLRMIDHVDTRIVNLIFDAVHRQSRKRLERALSHNQSPDAHPPPSDLVPPRPPEPSGQSSRKGASRRYKSPLQRK